MKKMLIVFLAICTISGCYENKNQDSQVKIINRGKILTFNNSFKLIKNSFFENIVYNNFTLQIAELRINENIGSLTIEAKKSDGTVCSLQTPIVGTSLNESLSLIQNMRICERQDKVACILLGYPYINLEYYNDDIIEGFSLQQNEPPCNEIYNCNPADYTYLDNLIKVESKKLLKQCV